MKIIWLLIFIIGLFSENSCSVKIDVSKTTTTTTTTESNNESLSTTTTSTTTTTLAPTTTISLPNQTTILNTTTTLIPTSTTTPKPNITDFNNTTTINETYVDVENPILQISNYYCKCDLKLKICDINCCCDIYCSSEIIKLFDCSKENFDLNDYEQNSALPSCNVNGGLLCVMEDKKKTSNEFFDINLKSSAVNYKWPNVFATEEIREYSDMYRFDDPILVFNENTEMIENFGEFFFILLILKIILSYNSFLLTLMIWFYSS